MTTKYLFQTIPNIPKAELFLPERTRITLEFIDGNTSKYTATDDHITYTDMWLDTDVTYDFGPQEIKETIIANSSKSPMTYKFRIEGFNHYNIQDGMILFFNAEHKLLYYIKKPFAILADGTVVEDHNSIQHSFCKESNIYTINIKKFADDLYPIMIDPTFGFDNIENIIESSSVGAINNSQVFLTGSNNEFSQLEYSNTLEDNTLLGSDIVTFHRNINTHLEFLSGSDSIQDIFSVKIYGKDKVTTVLDSSTKELILTATLSPVLLFAMVGDENNSSYTFKIKFSDSIREASSVFITTDLITDINGSAVVDSSLGVITQQPTKNTANDTQYDIVYSPPATIPEARDNVLLRATISVSFTFGNKTTTINKYLYSFIQLSSSISLEPFSFAPNATKRDFINSDLYAPTSNRGLVILDVSLGIIRVIDQNKGLITPDQLNVTCAGRIGKITDSPAKGILVCTKAGVYYYTNNPFEEPSSYLNPIKISNKVMVDFLMADNHLFFLEENGTIYRINYRHLLLYATNSSDISGTIDALLDTNGKQPFHLTNFSPQPSPYDVISGTPPTKLLPISVKSDYPAATLSTVYTGGANANWNGVAVLYQELTSGNKMVLSIAYAPTSTTTGLTEATDQESLYNKVVFATRVDSIGGAPYIINPIAKDDKLKIVFDFEPNKTVKNESQTYNYPILYVPPVKYAGSRVIVGGLLPDSARNNDIMKKMTPEKGRFYLCPRNVSIISVTEVGPFYDPVTGEEVI